MQANTETNAQLNLFITEDSILTFEKFLRDNEKSKATIEKYIAAVRKLRDWLKGRKISRELLIEYRDYLRLDHTVTTVNGSISAINSYLDQKGLTECKLKAMKVQRKVFCSADRELTRKEYDRLIETAKRLGKTRLLLIMETICSTGIRVSETEYITVEALEKGTAEITLKNKTRTVFLPKSLIGKLKKYAEEQNIVSGGIFITRNGTSISRKQIWAEMKSICKVAGVKTTCVFPHNLRHLFARCYYEKTHDVVKLSDMLGHSSIDTTRIYLISTGAEHAQALEELELVS